MSWNAFPAPAPRLCQRAWIPLLSQSNTKNRVPPPTPTPLPCNERISMLTCCDSDRTSTTSSPKLAESCGYTYILDLSHVSMPLTVADRARCVSSDKTRRPSLAYCTIARLSPPCHPRFHASRPSPRAWVVSIVEIDHHVSIAHVGHGYENHEAPCAKRNVVAGGGGA